MAQAHKNLGDILVQEGILSQQELEEVVEKSKIRNLSLEETLFRLGYISRDRLGGLYAQAYGGEFFATSPRIISDEAIHMLSAEKALQLQAVPYQLEDGDILAVLLAGPFERLPYERVIAELEADTGKKIHAAFCSLSLLQELLLKYYGLETQTPGPVRPDFAAAIASIKSDAPDGGLRMEFEELYDVGQTALIGARSHPFSRAVSGSIEEAKRKLNDAQKFMESDFEEEAVQMAEQAVQLLKEATQKADAVEKDWEKLVQQVKALRAKVNSLEEEGAAEYAPAEFRELSGIRESLIECVSDRNVDRLRYLLDQGMIITERVSLLSPHRNKDREEVMSSLVQMRQVIARARKAGAKDYAPDLLKEAYVFLDRAESSARRSRWDEVRSALASAEAKALEAERTALGAAEEAKKLTMNLRESIRAASGALEQAMAQPFAQEAIDELIRAKDAIAEAKTCFDSGQQRLGISLAEDTLEHLQKRIIPAIAEAEAAWNGLFRRTDECLAKIRSLDIPLMLKLWPLKVEALLHAERDMVGALCSRDRQLLRDAVSACESLLEEVEESYVEAADQIKNIESVVSQAADLLNSAASSGIDADVAPAFVQAGMLLENARKSLAEGNAQSAAESADAAVEYLRVKVIAPQRAVREEWADLILEAAGVLEETDGVLDVDAQYRAPKQVQAFYSQLANLFSAFASKNPQTLRSRIVPLRETLDSIRKEVAAAGTLLYETLAGELREVEQAVKKAVEKCSGYYAPDALESVYLDIKRLWQKLSESEGTLDAASEVSIRRDLAVARAKLWQVEFLRERFEREREEDMRQLRLKMDSARDEVEACAHLDFVGEDIPLMNQARSLLEQADNLLIEGDIEGSFELVRQSRAAVAQILAEAEEQERRWKELAEALRSEQALHHTVLQDQVNSEVAPDEFAELSALAEATEEIIQQKDIDALSKHRERVAALTASLCERRKKAAEERRKKTQESIGKVKEQLRLGLLLHADQICPDVYHAACSYDEIATNYLEHAEYALALQAAADALAKASDAVTLAQAGVERAATLASDYMNIAANHIAQGNAQAAADALKKGLSLVNITRVSL